MDMHARTMLSASLRFRGALALERAMEYCSQGGGAPNEIRRAVTPLEGRDIPLPYIEDEVRVLGVHGEGGLS
jgi:hypothetical protein